MSQTVSPSIFGFSASLLKSIEARGLQPPHTHTHNAIYILKRLSNKHGVLSRYPRCIVPHLHSFQRSLREFCSKAVLPTCQSEGGNQQTDRSERTKYSLLSIHRQNAALISSLLTVFGIKKACARQFAQSLGKHRQMLQSFTRFTRIHWLNHANIANEGSTQVYALA